MTDNSKLNGLLHRLGDAVNWRQESDLLAFHQDVDDTFPTSESADDPANDTVNDANDSGAKSSAPVKPSPAKR